MIFVVFMTVRGWLTAIVSSLAPFLLGLGSTLLRIEQLFFRLKIKLKIFVD